MSQYNVIITRSESTMIRVEAKDQDEALDKAEEEVFDNPDDMDWGSNDDYDFHIALVEEQIKKRQNTVRRAFKIQLKRCSNRMSKSKRGYVCCLHILQAQF